MAIYSYSKNKNCECYKHQPVLLAEVLEYLNIQPDGYYVDGTFGRGGHSIAILERLGINGRLLAIDQDPEAIAAGKILIPMDNRLELIHTNFSNLNNILRQKNWYGKVNGAILDLGVSSPQLECPERGFSFLHDGPLDMRMNPSKNISAAAWLNRAKEDEIAKVLKELGEERYAKRIAHAIVKARLHHPIERTKQLSSIVTEANPAWEKDKHPATRSFMAIRIYINKELEELTILLQDIIEMLAVGGRLLVVSFHSLEDRIVKRFFNKFAKIHDELPRSVPVPTSTIRPKLRLLKPIIRPGKIEKIANPRSRSAILRIAEKI